MSELINDYSNLENEIQESLNDFSYPSNDWDAFQMRYRRHTMMKRLKRYSVGVGIAVLAVVGLYYGLHKAPVTDTSSPLVKTTEHSTEASQKTTPQHIAQKPSTQKQNAQIPEKQHITKHQKQPLQEKSLAKESSKSSQAEETIKPNNNTKEAVVQMKNNPKEPIDNITSIIPSLTISQTIACTNSDITVSTETINPNFKYKWRIGENTFFAGPSITTQFEEAGQYIVSLTIVKDEKTLGNAESSITILNHPVINFKIKTIDGDCNIKLALLNANKCSWILDNADYYNSTKAKLPLEDGQHTIKAFVQNAGCKDTISYQFRTTNKIKMFVPTAFVPNGDGINDMFAPSFSRQPKDYKLLIFDSYEKLVFSSDSPQKQWDGKINGVITQGTYQWNVVYKDNDGSIVKKSGQVKLLLH